MEDIKNLFRDQPVTACLLAVNILVFLAVELKGSSEDATHMLNCGAAYTPYILEEGQYYRLFTAMFLHFGIRHLLNNMVILAVLGGFLERAVNRINFLIIYIAGGLFGNVISALYEQHIGSFYVSAGASGAVFAVLGALALVVLICPDRLKGLSVKQILVIMAFSVLYGFTAQGVDNAAHIGGLIGGFVLALLLLPFYRKRNKVG